MAKLHFRPSWLCVIAALLCMCTAINPGGFPNGVLTAPRGWRSWNAVAEDVTQSFILRQVDALVARRHSVDGKPTSLLDLGSWRNWRPGPRRPPPLLLMGAAVVPGRSIPMASRRDP